MKELEDYKKRVLALALRISEEEDWCRDGLIEALKEIDIDLGEKWEKLPIGSIAKSPDNEEVIIKFVGGWKHLEYKVEYQTTDIVSEIGDLESWTTYQPTKED